MLEEKKLLDLVSTFRMSFVSIVAQKHFFAFRLMWVNLHDIQPWPNNLLPSEKKPDWKRRSVETLHGANSEKMENN